MLYKAREKANMMNKLLKHTMSHRLHPFVMKLNKPKFKFFTSNVKSVIKVSKMMKFKNIPEAFRRKMCV